MIDLPYLIFHKSWREQSRSIRTKLRKTTYKRSKFQNNIYTMIAVIFKCISLSHIIVKTAIEKVWKSAHQTSPTVNSVKKAGIWLGPWPKGPFASFLLFELFTMKMRF